MAGEKSENRGFPSWSWCSCPPTPPATAPYSGVGGDLSGGFSDSKNKSPGDSRGGFKEHGQVNSQAHKPDEVKGDYSHGRGFFHF